MLPTLQVGPWQVGTYGIVGALTLVVCGLYAFHRLRRLGLPPNVLLTSLLVVVLAGFASTILMTSLINLILYFVPSAQPEGTSVFWAFMGGSIAAALLARRLRLSVGWVLDLAAPPWALANVLGRVGCLANGCCYGRPTDSWLAMFLPGENGVWAMRYPTQLMSLVANVLILVMLLVIEWVGRRERSLSPKETGTENEGTWPFSGFLFLLFLFLYGLKRFVMAYLRDSGPPLVGPFTWMHLNALVMLIAAGVLLGWNLYRSIPRDRP
ncbi:MAG: prolipoprotein diacylglyceryl transferase [Chloroflexi bacterium]|nr:prolipoprotein diacylglyceryl transferase [Chloroflexota bacterium]MBU1751133.1 prolipoprotein diacylglyceryl transferase [Chloroflexota bacterium]MBU1879511.1 prolipoprotein diacylglyceryl transferase [Chloroflexota bacterium]